MLTLSDSELPWCWLLNERCYGSKGKREKTISRKQGSCSSTLSKDLEAFDGNEFKDTRNWEPSDRTVIHGKEKWQQKLSRLDSQNEVESELTLINRLGVYDRITKQHWGEDLWPEYSEASNNNSDGKNDDSIAQSWLWHWLIILGTEKLLQSTHRHDKLSYDDKHQTSYQSKRNPE